jgi:hypothetical protein
MTKRPREHQVGNEESSGQEDETEHGFEKIAEASQEADGSLRYKVRWFGYGRESDTWEPVEHLPASAVRRYRRRTNLTYIQGCSRELAFLRTDFKIDPRQLGIY